jgi:hypothetical protein
MLNEQQVAELLNIDTILVAIWRMTGGGPPAVKVGGRWGYFWDEFEAWRVGYSLDGGAETSSSPPSSATVHRRAASPNAVSRAA